jgi:hypothetical protein
MTTKKDKKKPDLNPFELLNNPILKGKIKKKLISKKQQKKPS